MNKFKSISFLMVLATLYAGAFFSCSAPKPTVDKHLPALKNKLPDSIASMQQTGWDLSATGDHPSHWELWLNFDDSLRFSADDGIAFTIKTPLPLTQENGFRFDLKSPAGQGSLFIPKEDCTDKGNTRLTVRTKTYTGCGNILFNNKLHGTWELVAIGNKRLNAKDYPLGLPILQTDVDKQKANGHDGCKYYSADLNVTGKRLQLKSLDVKNKRIENSNCEAEVFQMLTQGLLKYEISGNALSVTLNSDQVLHFNRKFNFNKP